MEKPREHMRNLMAVANDVNRRGWIATVPQMLRPGVSSWQLNQLAVATHIEKPFHRQQGQAPTMANMARPGKP